MQLPSAVYNLTVWLSNKNIAKLWDPTWWSIYHISYLPFNHCTVFNWNHIMEIGCSQQQFCQRFKSSGMCAVSLSKKFIIFWKTVALSSSGSPEDGLYKCICSSHCTRSHSRKLIFRLFLLQKVMSFLFSEVNLVSTPVCVVQYCTLLYIIVQQILSHST